MITLAQIFVCYTSHIPYTKHHYGFLAWETYCQMIHAKIKSAHFPLKSHFDASIILWLALPCLSSLSLVWAPKCTTLHYFCHPPCTFPTRVLTPFLLNKTPIFSIILLVKRRVIMTFFPSIIAFMVQSVKETFPSIDPTVSPWEILWWPPTRPPSKFFHSLLLSTTHS